MAKGQAGRTYTRDSRGRFSSGGGGGKGSGKASGGRKPAAKPAAPARAKATTKAQKPAATATRGPKPPPPPWSPAMKRAAAKSKAQKATSKPANKIAASPRVPGTRDARLALPKSLTKKGWDYSQYMNRNDAESDRRYFAKQWTTAAKKEIQLRAELATLRKKAGGTDGQINAIKSKIKGIDQAVAKANATGQALQKRANERLKAAGRRVKEADKRVSEANKRLKAVNDKSSATRTSIAQRKADFQKRFGMTYEESLTRRGSTRRRKP